MSVAFVLFECIVHHKSFEVELARKHAVRWMVAAHFECMSLSKFQNCPLSFVYQMFMLHVLANRMYYHLLNCDRVSVVGAS